MKVTNETLLIEVATLHYPLRLTDVRTRMPDVSFAHEPDDSVLADLGYAVVAPVRRPAGDVVTESTPVFDESGFSQTWLARDYTPEEASAYLVGEKAIRSSEVNTLCANTLATGAPYQFPDGSVQHIQLRDGDRANLSGLFSRAQSRPNDTFYFRTYEDNIVALTAAQTLELSDAAFTLYTQILAFCWALKDQINAVTDLANLPTVPNTITY